MQETDFVGGNVTIPHKEKIYQLLEHVTPEAQKLKAVNTLYWERGQLIGHNTDGYGFITHLKHSVDIDLDKTDKVLVFGAGGAARPIIAALISEGVTEIIIANRTIERAKNLSADLKSETGNLKPIGWEKVSEHLQDADLIINTTSLGMDGQPALEIEFDLISPSATVYDIVYAPLETDLLVQAAAKGASTIDGLGMLLHQAVPGFEKWFGRKPKVTAELRNVIISDLEQNS